MTWTVRHKGSPRVVEGLSLQELVEGLSDGQWEATDEVKGPNEAEWVAIENHPRLEEIAADLEPPQQRTYDDETRMDMNALIDVCLVLLIFFILTTSYAALQKRLEAPGASKEKKKLTVYTKEKVEQQTIQVSARMEGGRPVIRVQEKEVSPERLQGELRAQARGTGKTILLFQHDDEVLQETVMQVYDKAKAIGLDVKLVVP